MSFKNIILGTQRKNYTHDLSFDNNTTMEFGVLQPLMSQYMFPNSSIRVNTKQLVRLAPMPTPSFARMYLANFASFVKMSDVVPYHESLLSKIPFSNGSRSYTPVSMPYTNNRTLLYVLLSSSYVDFYTKAASSNEFSLVTDESQKNVIVAEFIKVFFGSSLSSSHAFYPKFHWVQGFVEHYIEPSIPSSVTPLSADFSLTFGSKYLACFKFSPSALRLRKILLGLGYSLSFGDTSHLSFAPILAFYKAYYDRFGLVRDLPFQTTKCYQIIKKIEDYVIDYTLSVADPGTFVSFLTGELSECWFTSANSYIASHRDKLTNGVPSRSLFTLPEQNGLLTPNLVPKLTDYSHKSSVPFLGIPQGSDLGGPSSYLTQLSLDVLKRLTAFVNKDSAIGRRMSDWVRVHYGADVSNSLFEQSSRINEWRTNIDIDDVFSTSDTADVGAKHKGEYLGAYAGKGSGFSQSGFTYKAPVHGFIFVMSCIVPLTNTFQGNDPTLLGIDLDTIPQPEFDALGFEATPRSVFVDDNGVADSSQSSKSADTFGFVPRYTGYKVKKNVVNGDMSKGYFQTDLLPYFNDRILYNNTVNSSVITSDPSTEKVTKVSFDVSQDLVPNASTEFQRICRYAFIGDYNRLFYNDNQSTLFRLGVDSYPVDDNFIVQSVFDVKVSNFLKPVQNSYDTVDEDVDNNTTSVSSI